MTLKVNIAADTDDCGNILEITGRNVASVDASTCGDEAQAVAEAAAFLERMDMERLKVRYGLGGIELRRGDDLVQKAQELFHASCCFNLAEVGDTARETFRFGEPSRGCDITAAVHSALRISRHFDRAVSFTFNTFAIPPVRQKDNITPDHVRAVVDTYVKISDRKHAP